MSFRLVLTMVTTIALGGTGTSAAQSHYKELRIGESIAQLPLRCEGAVHCEGLYDFQWVRVMYLSGIVDGIQIIYRGETLHGTPVESTPITLAEAIHLHSLQDGSRVPVLVVATNNVGAGYGVADIANDIVYDSNGIDASSTVSSVAYVKDDAPVLHGENPLPNSTAILAAARGSRTYHNSAETIKEATTPLLSASVTSQTRAANRREAAEGILERSDEAIGSGKLTLALIGQVSNWFEIDKNHPDAVDKSDQLRLKIPDFELRWRNLVSYAAANKNLVSEQDLAPVPFELRREIDRKLRQLKAMGWQE